MRIRLVTDIPYYLIDRGIKDIMERNRQFNNSKIRGQMSAINRYPFDNQGAEFLGKRIQFFRFQRFYIKRRFYMFYQHLKCQLFLSSRCCAIARRGSAFSSKTDNESTAFSISPFAFLLDSSIP